MSDRGRLRPNNEDAILSRPDLGLFAVADGMGGHAAGEVASAMAVAALERAIENALAAGKAPSRRALVAAIELANVEIRARSEREPSKRGMGTTLTCLWTPPAASHAWVAHVGDSRLYRHRAGRLRQITVDHTWVQEEVDRGALTRAQARVHPLSSVLTRAVGTDTEIRIDLNRSKLAAGDVYLICSDGLSGMLDDGDIAGFLARPDDPATIVAALVAAANQRGGVDNISAIVLRAAERRSEAEPPHPSRTAPRSAPRPAQPPPASRRA